jgi:hypothetical protein
MAAIGVVAAEKTGRHSPGPGAGASPSALIDPCLVGTWRTLDDHQEFPVAGYGPVGVDGQGVVVQVDPDGSVRQEYGSASPYLTTTGGHRLQITVAGTVRGSIRTSGQVITFHGMSADGTVTATVHGQHPDRDGYGALLGHPDPDPDLAPATPAEPATVSALSAPP